MGDRANLWPSLTSDETLAGFRGLKSTRTTEVQLDAPQYGKSNGGDARLLAAVLDDLEAAKHERNELQESLRRSIAANNETSALLESRLSEVEETLDITLDVSQGLVERVNGLGGSGAELSVISGELASVVERLEELSTSANDSKVEVAGLSLEMAGMVLEIAESQSAVASIARDIAQVANQARLTEDQLSSSIAEVSNDVDAQAQQIERLGTQADVDDLATKVDELAGEVDGVQGDLVEVAGLVTAASNSVAETDRRVAQFASEFGALVARTEATEGDTAAALARAERAAASVGQRLDESETHLVSQIADVANNVGDLHKRVDDIDTRVEDSASRAVAAQTFDVADEVSELKAHLVEVVDIVAEAHTNVQATNARGEEFVERLGLEIAEVTARTAANERELAAVAEVVSVVGAEASGVQGHLVKVLGDSEARLSAELASVAGEVRAVDELARRARAAAEMASVRAEDAHRVGDEVRAQLDAEMVQGQENRSRLSAALKFLDLRVVESTEHARTPGEEEFDHDLDGSDRYRIRWEEHMQSQAELRRQRSDKP